MKRFFTLFVLLFTVVVCQDSALAADSFTWKQQTFGQTAGPVVEKAAARVWYSLVGTTLTVTAVIDSTSPSNYLFMRVEFRDFKMEKSPIEVGSNTVYQYGARFDQRYKFEAGSANVESVNQETNEVFIKFAWNGNVKLQNETELKIRITEGACKVTIKPELSVIARPSEKVKVKLGEDHRVTIFANKVLARTAMVKGATITLKHDGVVFEGDKTLTATTGNDGATAFVLKTREEVPSGTYTFTVNSKKPGFIDSKDSVISFEVAPAARYYYSKCNGLPFFEFDAGDKEKFEDDGAPFILSSGPSVRMAGIFEVPGRVRIDTTGGGAKVFISAGFGIPDVEYDGGKKQFTLYTGPLVFIAPDCSGLLNFAITELVSKISGGKIKDPKFEIIGDPAGAAGVKIGATMELGENTYDGCNSDMPFGTVYQPNQKGSVSLELGFLKGPSSTSLLATGTLSNFTPAPTWCIKEAKAEYRGDSSYFAISGKIKNALLSEASGLLAFRNGGLQTVTIEFTFDRCTPIPQAPSVCWRGGGFSVDNISVGTPLKGSVNAKFGPYDPLKDLYLLSIEGGFESSPAKVYGKVTGNILKMEKISAAKQYQAEVSGGIDLYPGELRAEMIVDAKMMHLGGDYFLTGKYTFGLGLEPFGVSASYDGSLTLPKIGDDVLPKAGKIGAFINKWAPYPLGKVSGSLVMQPDGVQKATCSYDFRNIIPPNPSGSELAEALRDIGQGTFSVDFTLLPSPAAWDFDGAFNRLITSLVFGGVNAKQGEERTQATEQSVEIPVGQNALLAIMQTTVANPNVTLVSPTGTTLSASDAANGIHRVRTPDGFGTMWVVKNPAPGTWIIRNPAATASDTISVYGVVPPPTMSLNSVIEGNDLVARWAGERVSSDAIVQIFVDRDGDGFNGQYVGTGTWSDGSLRVALQDSTIPCSFNVYAIVVGNSFGGSAYSTAGQHSNPRATLPVPQSAGATATSAGVTTINFAPVLDPRVTSVAVIDAATDSVLAAVFPFENRIVTTIENHEQRTIRLVSVNERGLMSCPSEPISITTSIDEEVPVFAGNSYAVGVDPHPVREGSMLRIVSFDNDELAVRVVDLRGSTVWSTTLVTESRTPAAVSIPSNVLLSGTYTVLVSGRAGVVTYPFVVIR